MSSIQNLYGITPEGNRVNKKDDIKQQRVAKNGKTDKADHKPVNDNAQISTKAKELLTLRLEARKYIDEIKKSETLTANDLEQLKAKIEQKYFTDPEVIDKIVDELLNLPNFLG